MIQHFLFYLCTKFDAFSPELAIPIIFLHQSTGLMKLNADLGSKTEIDFQDIWKGGGGGGSMCSAPFFTISEKLVAQGRPGPL